MMVECSLQSVMKLHCLLGTTIANVVGILYLFTKMKKYETVHGSSAHRGVYLKWCTPQQMVINVHIAAMVCPIHGQASHTVCQHLRDQEAQN